MFHETIPKATGKKELKKKEKEKRTSPMNFCLFDLSARKTEFLWQKRTLNDFWVNIRIWVSSGNYEMNYKDLLTVQNNLVFSLVIAGVCCIFTLQFHQCMQDSVTPWKKLYCNGLGLGYPKDIYTINDWTRHL